MVSDTQRTLLRVLGTQLFGGPAPDFEEVDWAALLNEARAQTVFPIVYSVAEPYLPETFRPKARSLNLHFLASNVRNANQHGNVHRLMSENRIPYVIMKGMASASYYPEPLLRVMGDVDFLVPEDRIEETKDLFLGLGYTYNEKSDHRIHYALHRQDEILELHRVPDGLPDGEKGELCRKYLSDVIETARPMRIQEEDFMIPGPFQHGLIMLLHTAKHLINTGVGLRHLCDWAVFAAKLSDCEFRELFEEKLNSVGLWRFAQLLTQFSVRYLNCPERAWAMEDVDPELMESLLEDVFASGNFGTKDVERINEAKLMTTDGTGTVVQSRWILLRALTEKAYLIMPVCRKVKLLLPVGWFVVGIRHLFLILRGRRPALHARKMISGAEKRRTIYQQLQLFQ